jgi:hypothetical protein
MSENGFKQVLLQNPGPVLWACPAHHQFPDRSPGVKCQSPGCAKCACKVFRRGESKSATVCSFGCQLKRRKEKKQEAAEKRKDKRKTVRQVKDKDSVLFHDCIFGGGGGLDPFAPERCRCRKLVSNEKAESLVARGEALDMESRGPVFTGGPIVQIGKLKRTGRSATVEKAHISRLVEKPEKKARERIKTLEELQAAVQQDKAERFEEEKLRLEIYGELTALARREWIVHVKAEEYDAAEQQAWGRALFTNFNDERTPGGIGIDVSSLKLEPLLVEREDELEDDVAVETEEVGRCEESRHNTAVYKYFDRRPVFWWEYPTSNRESPYEFVQFLVKFKNSSPNTFYRRRESYHEGAKLPGIGGNFRS